MILAWIIRQYQNGVKLTAFHLHFTRNDILITDVQPEMTRQKQWSQTYTVSEMYIFHHFSHIWILVIYWLIFHWFSLAIGSCLQQYILYITGNAIKSARQFVNHVWLPIITSWWNRLFSGKRVKPSIVLLLCLRDLFPMVAVLSTEHNANKLPIYANKLPYKLPW